MVRKKRRGGVILLKLFILLVVISLPVAAIYFAGVEKDKIIYSVDSFMEEVVSENVSEAFLKTALEDEAGVNDFTSIFSRNIFVFNKVASASFSGINRGKATVNLGHGVDSYDVEFELLREGGTWLVSELPALFVYQGAFVVREDTERLTVFYRGAESSYELERPFGAQFGDVVFAAVYENRVLLGSKMENIRVSRIMVVEENRIEGEEEGFFALSDDSFTVYRGDKDHKTVTASSHKGLIPGCRDAVLYLHDDLVFAVVLMDEVSPDNIRIAINDSNMETVFHPQLRFSFNSEVKMVDADNSDGEYIFPAGRMITVEHSSADEGFFLRHEGDEPALFKRRITFNPVSSEGRVAITGVLRDGWGWQAPLYRGSLDISYHSDGLIAVNELPFEEYLYSVVSSETDSGVHENFLKLQAIISRSVGYRGLTGGDFGDKGAHLDDGAVSQPYNKKPENDQATKAVSDTRGLVPFYEEKPIFAHYFPASCGYTANSEDVWPQAETGKFPGERMPYLRSRHQFPGDEDYGYPTDDESMAEFLESRPSEAYDFDSPYFRWEIHLSGEDLVESLKRNLVDYYSESPLKILTLVEGSFDSMPLERDTDGPEEEREEMSENNQEAENVLDMDDDSEAYGQTSDASDAEEDEDKDYDPIGLLKDIRVEERAEGGIVKVLLIEGSNGVYQVVGSHAVRSVLRPVQHRIGVAPPSLRRKDGVWVPNIDMLPSAFIYFDIEEDEEGAISKVVIKGGGLGHGVGLSQAGARKMVDEGKNYVEIISHYYPGTLLKSIY